MMAGVSCTLAEVLKDNRRRLFAAHTLCSAGESTFHDRNPIFGRCRLIAAQ
jgi:hypothetical protein